MASSPTKSGRVEDQPNMEITPTKSPCNQQIHTHKESKGYMHKFRLNICRDVVCENHEYKGSSLTQTQKKSENRETKDWKSSLNVGSLWSNHVKWVCLPYGFLYFSQNGFYRQHYW